MTIDEVVSWFGNLHQACQALQIASQNMTNWKEQGYIPWKQQFKLALITEGALMPDDVDPYLLRNPKKSQLKERTKNATEMEINDCGSVLAKSNSLRTGSSASDR